MSTKTAAAAPTTGFNRYRYSTRPDELPVDWDAEPSFTMAEIEEAGFLTPGGDVDNEAGIGRLTRDWNGHRAGARVISGLTSTGHPFAVERAAS